MFQNLAISAFLSSLVLLSASLAGVRAHGGDDYCTHGKLFVVDNSTAKLHVIDISQGNLQDLKVETSVELPERGAGGLVFYGTSKPGPVVVQYRGVEEEDYEGSFVRFIDHGFHGDHYDPPSIYQNALIDDCTRPIHEVHHDNKIAVFCDGAYDAVPQVNTTIHVVDETLLGGSDSAVVHSVKLPGTHHGVAIPVDDNHLLHSLAIDDRINRVPNVSSLPATFQVVNMDGDILHELTNTSDPDTHCHGFHGSASVDNQFVLGCDDVHGGVLFVDYDPAGEGSYTSRALLYPDDEKYENFRIGSFAYHKKSDVFVGSYALRGGKEFHLVSMTYDQTVLEEDHILTLPGELRQCASRFEAGHGEHLLVFMPNGVLHVFKAQNGVMVEVMNQEIVPGMTVCSEATFAEGVGQAFVGHLATNTLYAIDLGHVDEGKIEVYESTLPFIPTDMRVKGFTYSKACEVEHDDDDDTSAAVAFTIVPATLLAFLITAGLALSM